MPIVICLGDMMKERGVSLGELAERVGRTDVNLSRIKTGKILAIRFSTLAPICEVLKCQPGDIMKYVSDEEYARLQKDRASEEGRIYEEGPPPLTIQWAAALEQLFSPAQDHSDVSLEGSCQFSDDHSS